MRKSEKIKLKCGWLEANEHGGARTRTVCDKSNRKIGKDRSSDTWRREERERERERGRGGAYAPGQGIAEH